MLVDKSRTFVVTVTERDVHRGLPGKNCACPVAIAARRAFGLPRRLGGDAWVEVGYGHLWYRNFAVGGGVQWELPRAVRDFIAAFDNGAIPDPPAPFALHWPWFEEVP